MRIKDITATFTKLKKNLDKMKIFKHINLIKMVFTNRLMRNVLNTQRREYVFKIFANSELQEYERNKI